VDTWIELSDRIALKLLVSFIDKARKFFMDHVATHQEQWNVKGVYKTLFDYCFPAGFKLQLKRQLTHECAPRR
jgi:hypothetical protein